MGRVRNTYLGSLVLLWPSGKQLELWARIWNPRDGVQFEVVESALSGVGGQSTVSYLGFLCWCAPPPPESSWGPGDRVQFGAVGYALRGNHSILSPHFFP